MVDRAMAKPQRGEKIVRQVQKAESESKTFRQGKSLISSHHQLTFPVPWLTILWKVDMGGKYDVNGGNMMLSQSQSGHIFRPVHFPRQMKIVMKTIYTQQTWMIACDDLLPEKMGLIKKKCGLIRTNQKKQMIALKLWKLQDW